MDGYVKVTNEKKRWQFIVNSDLMFWDDMLGMDLQIFPKFPP